MPSRSETFHWRECAARVQALLKRTDGEVDGRRRFFQCGDLRLFPPLVFPIPAGCTSLSSYLAQLPPEPTRHTAVLMQAGSVSLGRFERGEELATKSFRRYVVRGKGRAQPTHLEAKGKSRYGSRLRLQNAQRLLVETSEKLQEWEREHGPADQVYHSAPVRLWASLFQTRPAPPFERTDRRLVRIPLDLPRPTTDVLRRAYRALSHGRLEVEGSTC